MTRSRFLVVGVGLAFVAPASAQQMQSTASIPLRKLENIVGTDSGVLKSVGAIRALSGGRVLVNDGIARRLFMFDSTMKQRTILADTADGAPANYGTASLPGLIPYLADTTLFVDRASMAFIKVHPDGKFGRVIAPPKNSDIYYMGVAGTGFDSKGRLIYRGYRSMPANAYMAYEMQFMNQRPAPGTERLMPPGPDSAPILRADFDTRGVDTIGLMKTPAPRNLVVYSQSPSGGMSAMGTSVYEPLPVTDEWALLPDGTIAIVRSHDYHIDWIAPDGTMTSTPKMPFDWKRITLEDKQLIVDSVKAARADWEAKQPPPRPIPGAPPNAPTPMRAPFRIVDAKELPDYYPPVRAGQVKADLDGNVWVLPSTSLAAGSGLVFDVINRKGEIFERVQIPAGRNLAGFGPDGSIYLTVAPPMAAPGAFQQQTLILVERGFLSPRAAPPSDKQ